MCPAERHSPDDERREHPHSRHARALWQPLQLTFGDECESAHHHAEDRAEQPRRLVGQRKQCEQRGTRGGACDEETGNREQLIAGFRRGADVAHADDAAHRHARFDGRGDQPSWQQAHDPVEDVERRERKARGLPSDKRNGGEDGAQ